MKLDEPALKTSLTLFLLSLNPTASSSNNCVSCGTSVSLAYGLWLFPTVLIL